MAPTTHLLNEKKHSKKLIYVPRNEFCMIWFRWNLLESFLWLWWRSQTQDGIEMCFKIIFGNFQCFQVYAMFQSALRDFAFYIKFFSQKILPIFYKIKDEIVIFFHFYKHFLLIWSTSRFCRVFYIVWKPPRCNGQSFMFDM